MMRVSNAQSFSWPPLPLWRVLSALIAAVAAVAIWSTARVFSGTVDEPAHIASGVELLTGGRYEYDLQHPTLGRIAAAIGPIRDGARFTGLSGVYDEGGAILGTGSEYVRRLASARHGEIVFFALLVVAVWWWAKSLVGEMGACVAVLLAATNPNILAHAGLATTDISCAATTTLALFVATHWLDDPSWRRTIWFGIVCGLAIGSRLSALAFVGVPFVGFWIIRGIVRGRWRPGDEGFDGTPKLVVAGAVAMLVVSTAYLFHVGSFVHGVNDFVMHGANGHPSFLLGQPSNRGWWYYFPIALAVKTPLPLLLLTILGAVPALRALRSRSDWKPAAPLVAALLILATSMNVKVDLGVRLVLAMYPLMAIVGAYGVQELLTQPQRRMGELIAAALLIAAIVIPVRTYPDQLAYFNVFAGDHPEHVLVDSNLDWGQDLYRLRDTLQARGIRDSVLVAYFGSTKLDAAGIPNARVLGLREHTTGWVAASKTYLAGEWVGHAYQWLLAYPPVAQIGPSMLLWHIPPAPTMGSLQR